MEGTGIRTRWLLLIAGGLVVGLSVVLAWGSLRSHRARIEREYRTQAELMAATYARVTGRWWVRGNTEMMAEAARLMVVGSALFVRVTVGEETLLDERDSGLIGEPPAVPGEAPRSTASLIGRTGEGIRYLDVIAPIFVSGLDRPIGHVRIGFDLVFVGRQTRARALGTAGVAAACDAALIGTVAGLLALRRKRRRSVGSGDRGPELGSVLVRGDLRVDPVSKSVTVRGKPVDLTPKQFNLLVLLAQVPGRVLSDDDILRSLWPRSAYADSSDVKQCVYTLRRRLERVVESPAGVIVNVKGYGYKLVPPGTEADLISS